MLLSLPATSRRLIGGGVLTNQRPPRQSRHGPPRRRSLSLSLSVSLSFDLVSFLSPSLESNCDTIGCCCNCCCCCWVVVVVEGGVSGGRPMAAARSCSFKDCFFLAAGSVRNAEDRLKDMNLTIKKKGKIPLFFHQTPEKRPVCQKVTHLFFPRFSMEFATKMGGEGRHPSFICLHQPAACLPLCCFRLKIATTTNAAGGASTGNLFLAAWQRRSAPLRPFRPRWSTAPPCGPLTEPSSSDRWPLCFTRAVLALVVHGPPLWGPLGGRGPLNETR